MSQRLSSDTVKKIKQIEITTRRLMNGALVGDARSAIKGAGFDFDQIREYQMGDDIRFIDWASSARTDKILIRQYMQERDRTIIIALDISASGLFSSGNELRKDVMAQVACVLALVSDYGKDAVGLVLFSEEIEYVIPPSRGLQHVYALMEKVFEYKPIKKTTALKSIFDYVTKLTCRDALVVVISDFIDKHSFEKQLRVAAIRHDLILMRCLDKREEQLVPCGFVTVEDPENGVSGILDMRVSSAKKLSFHLKERIAMQDRLFKKYGVDSINIYLHEQPIAPLIRFFRRRMMY
jgi:uncharacterized protein (DUF58 family)